MEIVTLTGDQLTLFIAWVKSIDLEYAYRLSVGIDVDGVKLKSNEGIWSYGIGELQRH